jgi:hypothetical protein
MTCVCDRNRFIRSQNHDGYTLSYSRSTWETCPGDSSDSLKPANTALELAAINAHYLGSHQDYNFWNDEPNRFLPDCVILGTSLVASLISRRMTSQDLDLHLFYVWQVKKRDGTRVLVK